jgi:hypothetical protein
LAQITFSWTIPQLQRRLADGFVFLAEYIFSASDEHNRTSFIRDNVKLSYPSTFIPYENLTEELCIEWVQSTLGEEKINQLKDQLIYQLREDEHPTEALGVPWAQ